MIKLVIIAPYREMQEAVEQTLREYRSAEPVSASVYLMTAEQVEGTSFNCDVVIARGFTVDVIQRRFPEQPVVPLGISGYDVIEAISNVIQKYKPRKVAFIGPQSLVHAADRASRIFNVPIVAYDTSTIDSLRESIDKAKQDGCDCFVGGLSMMKNCAEGEHAEIIQSGNAAIISSLDEAVRLVRSTRRQRERTARYKTIFDYSKEGMISLGESRRITSINQMALHYLNIQSGSVCIGRPVRDVIPFAYNEIQAIFEKGLKTEKEICEHAGRLLAVDCIPIRQDGQVTGGVLFIRSANSLQREESLVRKKIFARGQHAKYRFEDIVHSSHETARVIDMAKIYAETDSPVLIMGESGTGKEMVAQGIHNQSGRSGGPFIAINCAALPENLLESELFGYVEGAFTGASKGGRPGLFEAAHGGTLFLDEISEIPIFFQSKLLRVLQENEVRRIGSQTVVPIDVRIIAATNQNLRDQVEKGLFRRDLLFRLNVLSLYIPPLRARSGDIKSLFDLYLNEYSLRYGKNISMITAGARELLERHAWEGNVRELKNIAERVCVLTRSDIVDEAVITSALTEDTVFEQRFATNPILSQSLCAEEEEIRKLLRLYGGNKGKTAEALGIDRTTLWRKIKKYGI